jgi:glycosyltransferase involved in cell wall biosynthesis
MSDFRRFLRVQQPDLVHANSLYTFAEALVARSTGLPAFLHVHEMMPANWKSPAAVTIAGRLGIDLVAVSLASGEPLRRGGRFPLIVHESAPVPELARPAPSGDAPLVVGSVGVISRRKGSDIFVEAARQVLEQRDDVTFRLVGRYPDSPEAPWAEAVLNRARAIGITHIPHVDVYEELRRWDIFALASRRDPFPLVVLEAMATGLPVVASASDGIVEQLEPSCGVLVPPDDASELARGIIDLVDRGPARRAAMGRAARQRVADHFTPEHQARELERAYLAVIDRS